MVSSSGTWSEVRYPCRVDGRAPHAPDLADHRQRVGCPVPGLTRVRASRASVTRSRPPFFPGARSQAPVASSTLSASPESGSALVLQGPGPGASAPADRSPGTPASIWWRDPYLAANLHQILTPQETQHHLRLLLCAPPLDYLLTTFGRLVLPRLLGHHIPFPLDPRSLPIYCPEKPGALKASWNSRPRRKEA